jgi:hypothetical protein
MSAQICLARHPVVFLPATPWPASSPRSSSSLRCQLPGPLPACFHAFASVFSVSVLLSHPFLRNISLLSVGSARVVGPSVRVDSMGFGPYCWYRAQERLHFLYESRLAVGKSSEGFQALQQSTPGPTSRPLLHRRERLIVRYYLIPVSTFIVPHLRVQIS